MMMRYLLLMLLLAGHSARAMDIEVRALFEGAALLVINGDSQLLKSGETSEHGVELLDADSRQAVVRLNDETLTLALSERISSSFQQAERSQVQISIDRNRQYLTAGVVNGRPVRFLVDTGANIVALNENKARSLGISLEDAIPVQASTASDDLPVLLVNLREIQVGAITRRNVQAIVMRGNNPRDILLGMSFLQHVEISEKNGLMTLTSKY